ncbi:hypothetical protein [Okeania sp. SIO1F9]|uniref:hypothetical protein n=1 Tax=Okeania sp. SIO1F9 TaxID=2607813 RepID=UPI00144D42AA|nr:hypothetical protein [Okeania sp. SIO1F9]NET78730.1 hypothetical protein [Okeania sp. SIO1F9]
MKRPVFKGWGITPPITPISWWAFPRQGSLARVTPLSRVKLALPMLSVSMIGESTGLTHPRLFNLPVLEHGTSKAFQGRNFSAYRQRRP